MLSAHFSVRVCEGADLVSEDDVAAFVGDADGAVTLLANPVTDGVLERCRGLRVGGAQVSEKHCNFFINTGDATAADIEALGEEVRRRVKAQSGVMLEWEIRRIGNVENI